MHTADGEGCHLVTTTRSGRSYLTALLLALAAGTVFLTLVGCVSRESVLFDQEVWRAAKRGERGIGMAFDVERRGLTKSKTATEVADLLGDPDVVQAPPEANGWYDYWLSRDWELEVYFEDGISTGASVVEP